MDWKFAVQEALAAVGCSAHHDVIEELAAHALSDYEAARAEGCDEEEAKRRVFLLLAQWQRNAALLKRPKPPPAIDPPPANADERPGALTLRLDPAQFSTVRIRQDV
jgi:hypothetical protein